MVFFNPALMHAAGENTTTDQFRLANLLQISSPFGRSIESLDFISMVQALYPTLLEVKTQHALTETQLNNVICACTDGYPFPTCLDTDLPTNGLAPKSQRQYVLDALKAETPPTTLMQELHNQQQRQDPSLL